MHWTRASLRTDFKSHIAPSHKLVTRHRLASLLLMMQGSVIQYSSSFDDIAEYPSAAIALQIIISWVPDGFAGLLCLTMIWTRPPSITTNIRALGVRYVLSILVVCAVVSVNYLYPAFPFSFLDMVTGGFWAVIWWYRVGETCASKSRLNRALRRLS